MKIRLLFACLLAVAVFSIPTFAQTTGTPVPAQPKIKVARPVLYIDVQTETKGLDPVSTVLLKSVIAYLNESFDIRGGRAELAAGGFEIRMLILVKDGQYYVSAILLAKIRNEQIRAYVSSSVLITTKDSAEASGQDLFNDIDRSIDAFLTMLN